MPDVICRRVHRARKVHVCDACALRVEPGEKYVCESVCDPGVSVWRWRTHAECDAEILRLFGSGLYDENEGIPRYAIYHGTVEAEDLSPEYARWLTDRRLQEGE